MALPSETMPMDGYLDDLLYTGSYLLGTKGLAPLGKKVLDGRQAVQNAIGARNAARDGVVQTTVAEAIAWDALQEPLESFHRYADSYFDKDRAGFNAVFPLTLKAIASSSRAVRPNLFKPIVQLANKRGLPREMAASAKTFLGVWGDYSGAVNGATVAQKTLSSAVGTLAGAKRKGVVLMRETEGTLRVRYADDPAFWKKFFRQHQKKKAPADPPADGESEGSEPTSDPAKEGRTAKRGRGRSKSTPKRPATTAPGRAAPTAPPTPPEKIRG